ncbi:mono/diheme cytochrome c family protein [Chitinophaga niastensis]|uniref:Mono/diheme cytochrome c family protein n=1 Tax=Chitinophaga niastensis TaxID=536980 RepID=A0A2P8HGV8_CHINA|nr:cytochrome c [Chitinophaga niastensis]PSL45430.1 mono/diheme cytochrome c family protein [Chitinophaga niastensis]
MKNKFSKAVIPAFFIVMLLVTGSSFKAISGQPPVTGDVLYRKTCRMCHGNDGTKGMFGAKNLQISKLETAAIVQQIREGKGNMPSFKNRFSGEELAVLADYVKSFRQH